ncbi:MAG TPA: HEPN domain-containing protein [Hyphomicrobiaceae bacterium]|jgi:uncharacterized protein (UPF0332 family)
MSGLWKKARDDIDAADVLIAAGHPNAAVSRAYYAMFNAAKIVLAGIDPKLVQVKSHASIIRRFGKHAVEARGFDRSLGRMFSKAEVARHAADYEEEGVHQGTARNIVDEARRFVAAAEQFLARIES